MKRVFDYNGKEVENEGQFGTAKEIRQFLRNSKVTLERTENTIHTWGLTPHHPEGANGPQIGRLVYDKTEALKVALQKDKTMKSLFPASRALVDGGGNLHDRLNGNQGVIRTLETKERRQMEAKLEKLMAEVAAEG